MQVGLDRIFRNQSHFDTFLVNNNNEGQDKEFLLVTIQSCEPVIMRDWCLI